MSSLCSILGRLAPAPRLADPERGSTAGPWLLLAAVVFVVGTAAAAALFALHYPVGVVLSLIGGAATVAMTTVVYLYQLFTRGRAALWLVRPADASPGKQPQSCVYVLVLL